MSPARATTEELAEWLSENHLEDRLTKNLDRASWLTAIEDTAALAKMTKKITISIWESFFSFG